MSKYLVEAEYVEAMNVFYDGAARPEPLQCTVWTGDFMALGKHNIPCPVCFDRPAMLCRNVTPGRWSQSVQPCGNCQSDGYRVLRLPKLFRKFFKK